MIYLDLNDLLHIGERILPGFQIRDAGLLEAAAARPRTTAFGQDAYATIHAKAAALLHSTARNHALVDGNKPLALAAVIGFYGMNGMQLTVNNDDAYELVMAVAAGELDNVPDIADRLGRSTKPWRCDKH